MSDWQPGDLALCVKVTPWVNVGLSGRKRPGHGPAAGAVLSVREVGPGVVGSTALKFTDFPDKPDDPLWRGFESSRFVKVTPPEADEFDRETIALEQRKPVEVE